MTVQTSAGITSDGIVFCLDAGNPISYPKTGSTIFDVAGRRTISIVNSPTYNTSNLGFFSLNGTNQRFTTPALGLSVQNGFTVTLFIKMQNPQNSTGWNYFSTEAGYEAGSFGTSSTNFLFKDNNIGSNNTLSIPSIPNNNWCYIAFGTEAGSRQPFGYRYDSNGFEEVGLATQFTAATLNFADLFGTSFGTNFYRADVSYVSAYNRKLSANEFKDNYFALRSRFL
jgi:hypothetical protein